MPMTEIAKQERALSQEMHRKTLTIEGYQRLIARSGLFEPDSLISDCCYALARHSARMNYVCVKCNRACHMVNLGMAYGGNFNPPEWRKRGTQMPEDACKGCHHSKAHCLQNDHCKRA